MLPIYYLFGTPIGHSLSPLIHSKVFEAKNNVASYQLLETDDLNTIEKILSQKDTQGASVTIPLKENIGHLCSSLSESAQSIGAINTLIRTKDGWLGENTDWSGIYEPLNRAYTQWNLQTKKILILGAGGAGRAACFACKKMGLDTFIWNRDHIRAEKVATEFDVHTIKSKENLLEYGDNWIVLSTLPPQAEIIIPEELWSKINLIFDIVYTPYYTPLLMQAKQYGIPTIHGIEMLLTQAYKQNELWTGNQIDTTIITENILYSLQNPL